MVTSCEAAGREDGIITNREFARQHCDLLMAGGRPVFEPSNSLPVRKGVFVDGMRFETN